MASRRRAKHRASSGAAGAPDWVVTYTDMISLLVTFFVLLMTFSSMGTYDAEMVDAFLPANRGVHNTRGFQLLELSNADLLAATSFERGARQPHTRSPDRLPESLEEMGQRKTDEHLELDLTEVSDGLVIEFHQKASFDPGSARVNAELARSLGEVARVLENYPHLVVVEGCTDDGFRPTPHYASPTAMSVARARAAAAVMLRESQLNRDLIQVAGLGSAHPRADDESARGRRLNRRVRLRVLSLSKARAAFLESEEAKR